MRRRVDPSDLSDCTTRPHLYLDEFDGVLTLDVPPPVLRDEALWAELRAAEDHLREVRARVARACTHEPLDAFEVACGRQLLRMLHDQVMDLSAWDQIEDALIAHAERLG